MIKILATMIGLGGLIFVLGIILCVTINERIGLGLSLVGGLFCIVTLLGALIYAIAQMWMV